MLSTVFAILMDCKTAGTPNNEERVPDLRVLGPFVLVSSSFLATLFASRTKCFSLIAPFTKTKLY